MFRALTDVYDSFYSVQSMIDYFARDNYNMSAYARPGAWNDPDQVSSRLDDVALPNLEMTVTPMVPAVFLFSYTSGEVTSQNLWPRYDRHFVGIARHNVWSSGAKSYRVI